MNVIKLAATLLKAWRTLEPAHWSEFADAWCHESSHSYWHWLVAGKALNAAERYGDARDAFTRAIELKSDGAAYIGLGRALKGLGERAEAIQAFELAYHQGAGDAAARQLCRYGARDCIPALRGAVFPVRAYAEFIDRHPVTAPPTYRLEALPIVVHLDARNGSEEELTRTLRSLLNQTHDAWRCVLLVKPTDACAVAAEAADFRLSVSAGAEDGDHSLGWHLDLSAGTLLDPHALSWFAWAICTTGCATIYADHDHYSLVDGHPHRSHPVLHPMLDPVWFAADRHLPAIKISNAFVAGREPSAHVPRILASLPLKTPLAPHAEAASASHEGCIFAIIPTKDNVELLSRCIKTLLKTAAQPDRVQFRIVDNGKVELDAGDLHARLGQRGSIEVVRFDEPFNWSRANNLGAAGVDRDHLLFLNDDTEMRTQGWDDILIDLLEGDGGVGIVGAQLLYPAGAIQHAGFVFGMDNGPQHEGRWMDGRNPGPEGRWQAARRCVAVTGAFMAMRRRTFDEIGPFDELRLAVDFSDVDMCLRARRAGLQVIYAPQLKLLHLESISRGYNRSRRKRARAKSEFEALKARWGNALDYDPGYNPQWTREGCSFDGYREPTDDEIVRHIMQSARPDPWRLE